MYGNTDALIKCPYGAYIYTFVSQLSEESQRTQLLFLSIVSVFHFSGYCRTKEKMPVLWTLAKKCGID